MGFFDAIKKAFDSGGLKVRMKTPRSFAFKDGSIPASVTFTGHKTEPRTVTNMRFTFKAEPKEGEARSLHDEGDGLVLRVDREESFELQPLEETTIDFAMPLATGAEAGKVGAAVGKMMDVIGMLKPDAQWYVLTVEITVEGAKAKKRVKNRIQNGAFSTGVSFTFGR